MTDSLRPPLLLTMMLLTTTVHDYPSSGMIGQPLRGVRQSAPRYTEQGLSLNHSRMLLTIRTTYRPATDLGFLLHKHPEHVHTREFPFGNATVFYPESTDDASTAAILLDVDPIGMVRGRGGKGGAEDQY